MIPTFFGSSLRQLYGVHHAARGEERAIGVVLCPPAPQGMIWTHWPVRKLGQALSQNGFHVLRFDYYGTGDSSGASNEGTLPQWTEDIRTASTELMDMTGVERIALVGLRLGAALALRAVAAGLSVASLVMWEPVLEGSEWLKDLDARHVWREAHELYPRPGSHVEREELLGFPFPSGLREDVSRLNVLQSEPLPAVRTAVVTFEDRPEMKQLGERFAQTGAPFEVRSVQEPPGTGFEAAVLSNQAHREISAVLEGKS